MPVAGDARPAWPWPTATSCESRRARPARSSCPCCVQPGQHDGVVAVALGYGRLGSERFANVGPRWIEARPTVGDDGRVGRNAAPLAVAGRRRVALQRRAGPRHADGRAAAPLAQTQSHHEIAVPAHLAPAGGRPPPDRAGDDAAGVREGSVSRVARARRGGRGPVAARPYLHRPPLGHGDRPDGVHGLLGLRDRLPGREQRAGGRPRRSAAPPRDALDAHRPLLRRPAGRRRGRRPPADAVPALRERVVRDGVPGAGHRAQRGRAQPAGLQPLRGHALLRQQLPLQGAALQLVRLPARGPAAEPGAQPGRRRCGRAASWRSAASACSASRRPRSRRGAQGQPLADGEAQTGLPAVVPGAGHRVRRRQRPGEPRGARCCTTRVTSASWRS